MTMSVASERVQLGSYAFDPARRLLLRNGGEVAISLKAAELLSLLLANINTLVPRETIFARLWPEGFVHEGNLTQTIYLLRRSLAADPAVAIENVPRRGYCLRVRQTDPENARHRPSKTYLLALTGSALAAIFAIAGWMVLKPTAAKQLPLAAREDIGLAMYHVDRFSDLGLARSRFERITTEAPGRPEGYAGLALLDAFDGFDSSNRDRDCFQGQSLVARANGLGVSTLGDIASAMLDVTCDRSLPQARRELDAALARSPFDALALTLRSRVAFWENRPNEAVSFASRAVAEDATSPEALLALGLAYYYSRDFKSARETLERLLELMPGRPVTLAFLERTYEGLGDLSDADRTVRAAQRNPKNARWVWAARARLLALTGHRLEALALLRRWSSISDPEALAAAYAAAGNDESAIKNLTIAASRNSLALQVSWLADFRFVALRRRFPDSTPAFVTWRD